MECPYCGNEMKHGFLQGSNFLWSVKKHTIALKPGKDEIYALYLKLPAESPHKIESDYCLLCKKLIVDCSAYPHSETDK